MSSRERITEIIIRHGAAHAVHQVLIDALGVAWDADLAAKDARIAELDAQNQSMFAANCRRANDIQAERERTAQAETRIAELEDRVSSYGDAGNNLLEELAAARAEAKAALETAKASSWLDVMNSMAKEANAIIKRKDDELSTARAEIEALRKRIAQVISDAEETAWRDEAIALRKRVGELEADIRSIEDDWHARIASLENSVTALMEALERIIKVDRKGDDFPIEGTCALIARAAFQQTAAGQERAEGRDPAP